MQRDYPLLISAYHETETHRAQRQAYVSGHSYAIFGMPPLASIRCSVYDVHLRHRIWSLYLFSIREKQPRQVEEKPWSLDNPVCQVFGSRTQYLIDIADTDEYFFVFSNIYPPTWGKSKLTSSWTEPCMIRRTRRKSAPTITSVVSPIRTYNASPSLNFCRISQTPPTLLSAAASFF